MDSFFEDIKEEAYNEVIENLELAGKDIIKTAFEKANFNKNRTQNLRDSYAWAVFCDGKLISKGFESVDPQAKKSIKSGGTYHNGRNLAIESINSHVPTSTGFELYIVAAIFYANILEASGKFHVISSANSDIDQLAEDWGGILETEIDINYGV